MNKKEYAVLGLGRFGRSIALSLAQAGCEVMVADKESANVSMVVENVVHAEIGDVTNREFLESLGLSNYDGVIIGIGSNLESCVMATLLAKEVGAKFVIAKAGSDLQAKILKKIGADRIIFPEYETGIRLANQLVHGNGFDVIELSSTHSIMEVDVPEQWVGKTLKTLDIRAKYKVNIIGIKHEGELLAPPDPDMPFSDDDVLIALGENNMLDKMVSWNKG